MPGELTQLEFPLDDGMGGLSLTPATVSLPSEADERKLADLWRKGRVAWRDVASATDWVELLRGNSG